MAEAKGILAEVWLSSDSLFAGDTDKAHSIDDGLKSGWIANPRSEIYAKFWDITPRAFFLIATNYMGIEKLGFVLDRHPGDQVWNQPMVGYRILPINAKEMTQASRDGKTVWAVPMKMKIYWGNDLDTPPGVVSNPIDLSRDTNDSPEFETNLPKGHRGEEIYDGRVLEFTLFFDSEVKVSDGGKTVVSAGRMVGDGVWMMQENPKSHSEEELENSHPDFVWLPTNPILDSNGSYGNPYMVTKVVRKISAANQTANAPSEVAGGLGAASGGEPAEGDSSTFKIAFAAGAFDNLQDISEVSVIRKMRRLFSRAGYKVSLSQDSVEIKRKLVTLLATFPEGVTETDLKSLFEGADVGILSIEATEPETQ